MAHRVDSNLCYWILTKTGQILARMTVQRVTKDKSMSPEMRVMFVSFDKHITQQLDDANFTINPVGEGLILDNGVDLNDEPEGPQSKEANDFTEDTYQMGTHLSRGMYSSMQLTKMATQLGKGMLTCYLIQGYTKSK